MKNLLLIFTLLFTSVFFSSPSFAGWTSVSKGVDGDTFYIDFERIRKHDGFVYYWTLTDALVPTVYGDLSWKTYHQGDCDVNRYKRLGLYWYTQPMGKGPTSSVDTDQTEWKYTIPESSAYYELLFACKLTE